MFHHLIVHGLRHLAKENPAAATGVVIGAAAASVVATTAAPVVVVAALGGAIGHWLSQKAKGA